MPEDGPGWWRYLGATLMILAVAGYFIIAGRLGDDDQIICFGGDAQQNALIGAGVAVLILGGLLYRIGDLMREVKILRTKQETESLAPPDEVEAVFKKTWRKDG